MQNPTPALQTTPIKPKLPLPLSLCFCLFLSISATLSITYFFLTPKIAYVNTGKLIIGFSEANPSAPLTDCLSCDIFYAGCVENLYIAANKIEKEVKAEDDKWQAQYKSFGDSLQATIDGMSKEYNTAKPARKKELQDMLSARNQQISPII
jgi:Skp family chaperone for outer membrane proteins